MYNSNHNKKMIVHQNFNSFKTGDYFSKMNYSLFSKNKKPNGKIMILNNKFLS